MTEMEFEKKRWSLDDLFTGADSPELEAAFNELETIVGAFEKLRERLTDGISSEVFMDVVSQVDKINRIAHRMYAFVELWYTEDTQNQQAMALLGRIEQFVTELSNRTLFFNLWWKKLSNEDAERLMRILEGMEEAARRNDLDEWIVRDKEWHDLVFSILGNDRLEAIIHNLNDQWHRLRVGHIALGGRLQKSCAEHREISEAICAGDAEGAERAMKDHLHGLRESLVNVLENLLLPFVGDRI